MDKSPSNIYPMFYIYRIKKYKIEKDLVRSFPCITLLFLLIFSGCYCCLRLGSVLHLESMFLWEFQANRGSIHLV